MTLHAISAGSGIDYLMRTVTSGDREIKNRDLNAYWSSGGDTPGQWLGRQSAELGLTGQVTQEAADAIFKDGINPATGKPLGRAWPRYPTADERYAAMLEKEPNATEARRIDLRAKADRLGEQTARAGWETVLSPVKSYSVMWGVSDDATRAQLEAAEAAAFAKVWARVEAEAAWTRIGPQGVAQVEAMGLIAAAFVHRSSRAGDPDWHRHVAISSKVQTADGRWLALDARPLHRITVALSEMYTTELEREMYDRFGILAAPREDSIKPDKRPIREFLGVDAPMVGLFSQRRRQTERALKGLVSQFREREGREPNRVESYALAQAAALTARPDKHPRSVGAERRQWRRRAWSAGFYRPGRWVKHAQELSRVAQSERPAPRPLDEVAALILETLEQHRESWTRANAEAETYRQLTASGWHIHAGGDFDRLVTQITDTVLHPGNCEMITPPEPLTVPSRYLRRDGSPIFVQHGSARFTSHRIKQWEADIVESANRPTAVRRLTAEQIDAALAAGETARGFQPSPEQRAAVHDVFSGDTRTHGIIGYAGTGKTTIMRLVKEVADRHGFEVIGLANGQVQADGLAETAGIRAENIRRWRVMSERFGRGQAAWTLRPETIVIIDESGQASTPDIHAILGQVEDAGGRMLPIGDPKQLGSPGVGGILALLEAESRVSYLTEVRRFRAISGDLRQWEIDAAQALSHRDADGSFDAYNSRGRIHAGSLEEMLNASYEAWQRDTADGLTSILMAPSNALAAQLSERARADRVAAGTVDDRNTVNLPDDNRVGAGDRIVTRINNRHIQCEDTRQWVRNGDVWNVTAVLRGGALLVEHAITGGRAELPADYVSGGGVQLGYAITKDRAQGVTVQTGHGLLIPGMDANGAYPLLTRGQLTNDAYLSTEAQIDPESGEPGRPVTPRQAWAAIVSRDGTQLSATARQRQLWDEVEAIRTGIPRLRYVLDDIADTECRDALARLIGQQLAELLYAAPAWPALRAQLSRLADERLDTDALVIAADATRAWDGDIDDYAAILHSRVRLLLEEKDGTPIPGAVERYTLPDEAPRPSSAPTYEVDPEAVGNDVLRAIGLRLPTATGDDRHAYVGELVRQILDRTDHLARQARAHAAAGQGWAAAYGPEPEDLAEAVAWRDRIAAAAAYRDLADYTGSDATGPAPTDDQPQLRGLWRAAQITPDDQAAHADALITARSGATWLDDYGTPPATGNPTRPAWARAVAAAALYRRTWEFGHETEAIGEAPTDPVQAADHEAAVNARAEFELIRAHPSLAEADRETLAILIARGNAGEVAAEVAAAAIAHYDASIRAEITAAQAAEDAANRAAAAHRSTDSLLPGIIQDRPELRDDLEGLVATRLAELDYAAEQTRTAATEAEATTERARAQVEATAPGALAAREAMRRANEARREIAQRLLAGASDGPGNQPSTGPEASRWDLRPHGELTEPELVTAANLAVTEAVTAEQTGPEGAPKAAALREEAAALRDEYRTRALMTDEQRAEETAQRAAYRSRSPEARLDAAYADSTSPEAMNTARGRAKNAAVAPERQARPSAAPAADEAAKRQTSRPQAQDPQTKPRNRAEARLDRAYGDSTGPEAMDAARRRTAPAPADRPEPAVPGPTEQTPPPQEPQRRRSVAKRLDDAYDRDRTTPKGSPRSPAPDRRRRPEPPRPDGPRI